jgi:hypothetical protein
MTEDETRREEQATRRLLDSYSKMVAIRPCHKAPENL